MKPDEIKVPKKWIYGSAIGILILMAVFLFAKFERLQTSRSESKTSNGTDLAAGSPEKFALLSGRNGERSVGST